jgi:HEAT repeat protein
LPLYGPPDVRKMEREFNVQGLIKALGYRQDSRIRADAAIALGRIGSTIALNPLIAALNDGNSYVRGHVADALAKIGGTHSVEPLIALLKDVDRDVRRNAVYQLQKI